MVGHYLGDSDYEYSGGGNMYATYRVTVTIKLDVQAVSRDHAIDEACKVDLPDSYVLDSFDVTDVLELG